MYSEETTCQPEVVEPDKPKQFIKFSFNKLYKYELTRMKNVEIILEEKIMN
jgi:ubiquinone biosynthesis protein COQ9